SGFIQSQFIDPLFYNSLTLGYQRIFDSNLVGFSYQYNQHIISPYIGYIYNEDRNSISSDDKDALFYYDQSAFLGFTAPLFVWRRWQGAWDSNIAYEKRDRLNNQYSESIELTHQAQITYLQNYPLAYEPYRLFRFSIQQQNISSNSDIEKDDTIVLGSLTASGDLGWQNYLRLKYTEGVGQEENIQLRYLPSSLSKNLIQTERLFPEDTVDIKRIRSIIGTYKRPFETPYYFPRFPLSVRRSAIYIEGAYYDLETTARIDDHFTDWQYGIEIEGLAIHQIPLRMRVGGQSTTENQQSGFFLQINSQKNF
ncbi:MAG: hypothetical protein KDD34_09785, partial [Bdellovibrionales bacterium]|nr:hypothetical protein [Bdellovibrionales bacterium]